MDAVTHRAYISLGSNLGDRVLHLREAIRRLGAVGEVTRVSSFYETEPVEVAEQPWFVNAVVELRTEIAPAALLRALLELERAMGRERKIPKGPRTIDLDLLLYDNDSVNTPELTLPHPALHERRFVLEPLVEIAPGALHPTLQKTAWQLLETLPSGAEVRRMQPPKA
jgi:2-amino-4-hydroxy-6-hydroxymethyldihydropteridine diphosphokinase